MKSMGDLVALALADDDCALDGQAVGARDGMASTAAWSAAFSSPRPISVAAEAPPASVTRTTRAPDLRSIVIDFAIDIILCCLRLHHSAHGLVCQPPSASKPRLARCADRRPD